MEARRIGRPPARGMVGLQCYTGRDFSSIRRDRPEQGSGGHLASSCQHRRQTGSGWQSLSFRRNERGARLRSTRCAWVSPGHSGGNGGALRAGPVARRSSSGGRKKRWQGILYSLKLINEKPCRQLRVSRLKDISPFRGCRPSTNAYVSDRQWI